MEKLRSLTRRVSRAGDWLYVVSMQLRLWQRLFLALAVLSGTALLGFAAWQEHSFRRGFLGYLDEMSKQRLASSVTRLTTAYAQHGNWDFLRDDPAQFAELIEPAPPLFLHGPYDANLPPPPPPDDGGPRPGDSSGPLRGGHPSPHGPPDLMQRIELIDAAGAYVAGNPNLRTDVAVLPLALDGHAIGTLRLAPMPQISSATDVAFAQAQSRSAALAGAAILIGALVLSFALARWLLAPVRALASGTRALTAGDFSRRIDSPRNDELGALSRDFDHLAATLERHRDQRRQWGADIAHELRTPLSILRGEIQALQDGVRIVTPPALDSLQAECGRLGALIEDLYQLSLADAGALDYRFEKTEFDELVRESVASHREACAAAGLTFEEDIESPVVIDGDARRLTQLLDNVLTNSRRYTDAPGRVRVSLLIDHTVVRLAVDDTAPGVPASALPHLFDRLFRVEQSRSRAAGGAGLGLAICKAIVEAHHGTIAAEPSALGGLRITIDLPKSRA